MPNLKHAFRDNARIKRRTEDARTLNEYNASHPSIEGYIEEDPSVKHWLREQVPTSRGALKYIYSIFPFSRWIFSYNLQWLLGDLIAGFTVGLVVIPQGMAYAKIAQLPVQFGLYTSFMGALVYWIFGTSKDINIGPVAVASMVTGTIILDIREQQKLPESYEPFMIASALALITGMAITVIGFLRIGWIVDLIAVPAVSAFVTGSAITIALGQVSTLLGIRGMKKSDPAFTILVKTCRRLHETNIDAATGISSLALLYAIKYSCEMAGRRWPRYSKNMFFFNTMRTIFVLVLSLVVSYAINKDHKDNPTFRLVGFVPAGFRDIGLPKLDSNLLEVLLPNLPAMLIVLMIEHISIAKSFGRINNYTIDPSQEIIAIGVTNILGPFLGAFPATGSFSRTAIKAKAGVRTPFAGVIAAGVVLLAIYELTPVFFFVPSSTLAAVIIHAVVDMMVGPKTIMQFWRVSPTDVFIYMTGMIIIIFSSIENGIFVMIGLSLMLLLFRMFKAHGNLVGSVQIGSVHRIPGREKKEEDNGHVVPSITIDKRNERTTYLPLDRGNGANPKTDIQKPAPGVFVYRFAQDFNYISANHYLDHLVGVIRRGTRPTTVDTTIKPGDRPWNDPAPSKVFRSKGIDGHIDDLRPTLKAIILDMSAVSYVDMTAVQALMDARNVLDRYTAPHTVQWHFAYMYNRWTKRAFANAGFGYAPHDVGNGQVRQWRSFNDVADIVSADMKAGKLRDLHNKPVEDIEMGEWHDAQEFVLQRNSRGMEEVNALEHVRASEDRTSSQKPTVTLDEVVVEPASTICAHGHAVPDTKAKAVLYGINRPFFHVDLESAMRCVIENLDVIGIEGIK